VDREPVKDTYQYQVGLLNCCSEDSVDLMNMGFFRVQVTFYDGLILAVLAGIRTNLAARSMMRLKLVSWYHCQTNTSTVMKCHGPKRHVRQDLLLGQS
jgi:hypothetical protein